ncbi:MULTISPECIES: universal stress protein [unclassified Microbacterium]|uniref:universal stress protein n=1 Tax=unclassified Microbacterium TaxID=2609290 RepID=UPI001ACC57FE|nr:MULTISPECIES: universal stress protein [unclassified Microbacterium]MBN9158118.1 universal stress protein [Microbacterium sp.]MBS1897251.1 universal stress protein [Actinomycetota bacterium]
MDTIDTHRIIVGIDGSDSSVAALRYAARLADALDVPLEAVTTWYYSSITGAELVVEWTPEIVAEDTLSTTIDRAFGDTPPSRLTRTVVGGMPAATLIEMSRSCEMLVVGNRGHGGFVGLLLGSVSAACVRHAHSPVLVVRPQDGRADSETEVSS